MILGNKNIIVLGDLHFPFHNKKALTRVLDDIERVKPQLVIQIGDLYDQYVFSRYSKSINLNTPENEINKARALGEWLWKEVHKRSPSSKCVQLLGNHDVRLQKRIADKLPEVEHLMKKVVKDLYTFDGVLTLDSDRADFMVDDVLFQHGYLSKLGDHANFNRCKTVVGHSHVGGVKFMKVKETILWELNVGFLAEENELPLQYGPNARKLWTLGKGWLTKIDGIWCPMFIPLK
jgi:predicted phosphodiesterase